MRQTRRVKGCAKRHGRLKRHDCEIMNLRRNVQLRYVRGLYDALEDLRDKVRDHCPVIPEGVKSCLAMADIALIMARKDGIKILIGDKE